MDKEIQSIARNLENVLEGQPWYGRAVYEILDETEPSSVFKKPNAKGHSAIELLYHMITWAEFTLTRLNNESKKDMSYFESMDWREIDPSVHTWKAGMKQLKEIHQQIIAILKSKDDSILSEKVDDRNYNFRFLLHGLIQHNIYHLGQIAYIKKFLIG